MKYLYKVVGSKDRYFTEKLGGPVRLWEANVFSDPDDCILNQREMESYGYELMIYTDKEYFMLRLKGAK